MEQLVASAQPAVALTFLAGAAFAAVCGARSAPVGSTSGAPALTKFVWCLGPSFAATYLLAGGLLKQKCDGDERPAGPDGDVACGFYRYFLVTGVGMFFGHAYMTYQRFCGARLGNTVALVSCTIGQTAYLTLVGNWLTFWGDLPETGQHGVGNTLGFAGLFAMLGSLQVLLVIAIRAYVAASCGGCPFGFNRGAFEVAYFGRTEAGAKESLAVFGLFAQPFGPKCVADIHAIKEEYAYVEVA